MENQKPHKPLVTIGIVIAAAAGLFFLFSRGPVSDRESTINIPVGGDEMLESSLARLADNQSSARERLQAARWIGDSNRIVNGNVVQGLGDALMTDEDPTVRLTAAMAFGKLASRDAEGGVEIGVHEPQMLEVMAAAYDREQNASVRMRLIESVGRFNAPEAATLLEQALQDPDPSVRETAQQAKLSRERRLKSAVMG